MGNYKFGFTVYDVKVGIETNRRDFFEEIQKELPLMFPIEKHFLDFEETNRRFCLKSLDENNFRLEIDNEETFFGTDRDKSLAQFFSYLRVKIAEYAESKVFLHAGVVGWKKQAIIIPANSFKGKTTLVSELVKQGAEYYSDEYAVLDENGLVHPFPKMLSMRGIIDDYTQKDISPEEFGKTGTEPIPVGLVLFTEFKEDSIWQPEILSVGQSMLEIIPHTIPIRYKPEFSLFVLNKILSRAIIAKSQRSEASRFAKILIEYFETALKK